MIREEFLREAMLLGEENVEKLQKRTVAVFGLGGVGSFACEALARSGIGHFILVDDDVVARSNINRQLIALQDTIGKSKVDVMAQRIKNINPDAEVIRYPCFYLPENREDIFERKIDYIVDAIDTVSAKIDLALQAQEKKILIVSAMGTGNKSNPCMLEVDDISHTSVCPLCRVMRRELKKRGVEKLKVVYSKEEPLMPNRIGAEKEGAHQKRQTPGSLAFVPPVAGMILAAEVVKDLIAL